MSLTSERREPIAVAVASALARLEENTVSPIETPPARVAPVGPPRSPDDTLVDIPALYRELRMLADTTEFPRARHARDLREMPEAAAS